MANDLKLTVDNDLQIGNGDFVVDESELQEVGIILQMSQGEMKSDPFIGANLTTMVRDVTNQEKIKRHIQTQLELDEKDYDAIKEHLILNK